MIKAKKSLGQNFLINSTIIEQICDNIAASENDLIIEIGPGMGALTKKLKEKNSHLICYEIDTDLKPYLNGLVDYKTQVIYQDILQSNLKEDIEKISYENLYIVGNLPYYITTPIIKYLINLNIDITAMLFMVQKEVAMRFTATPNHKDYSSISLYLQYYFNVQRLFDVSKTNFQPEPKVESSIIKFTKRQNRPIVNQEKYFKLIDDSFKMKRKTLKNNLSNYNFDTILKILLKHNLSANARAEELSEDIFIEIVNAL